MPPSSPTLRVRKAKRARREVRPTPPSPVGAAPVPAPVAPNAPPDAAAHEDATPAPAVAAHEDATSPRAPLPAPVAARAGSPSRMQRLLLQEDARELAAGRRARLNAQAERECVRRVPKGGECPFHHPEDVLSAILEAVQGVTAVSAPSTIDLSTDPRHVFAWAVDALTRYGDECRAEGRAEATRQVRRPLPPEVGERLLATCHQMWEALKQSEAGA